MRLSLIKSLRISLFLFYFIISEIIYIYYFFLDLVLEFAVILVGLSLFLSLTYLFLIS